MKNTFGNVLTVTLFGESHCETIGCVVDGLAPGLTVSEKSITDALLRRRPQKGISTSRVEPDPFRIATGAVNGKTTGTPLTILIDNVKQNSRVYEEETCLRPGHADFTAEMKYHGFQDKRGGGHFSGRITAPLVAAAAILTDALAKKGIFIGTHIASVASVYDRPFSSVEDLSLLKKNAFGVLSPEKEDMMREEIVKAASDGDSVGGVLESMVAGLPAGVGEPWFDSLESMISHALFSIPAVKGIEFGKGFELTRLRGSEANDALYAENGKIFTKTNQNGGIVGGISNGMPLLLRTAIKPTPTIFKEQETVDWKTGKTVRHSFAGRHDPCIVPRARIVQDSMLAFVLADALSLRFGTDWLASEE